MCWTDTGVLHVSAVNKLLTQGLKVSADLLAD